MKLQKLASPVAWIWLLNCAIAVAADWETDFDKAAELAKSSGKYLLVDFSGSDWCGWCMKLDREVFSKKAFKNFAKEHLVLALIDFPRSKPQKTKEKKRNEQLAQQYGVKGFPTILLFSPKGELIGRTGYKLGGAEAYVAHLRELIEAYESKSAAP